MGGLADTRVYKEVEAAKLTIKQNPICLWPLVHERVEDDQRGAGVIIQTLGHTPIVMWGVARSSR
jgi:hypothetical protein